jgi:hypothetical protein
MAIDPQYSIINYLFIPFREFGFGNDEPYRHWLHIPRDDGKPQIMLAFYIKKIENGICPLLLFVEKIKKV